MNNIQLEHELQEILKLAAANWLEASDAEKTRRITMYKQSAPTTQNNMGWWAKMWDNIQRTPGSWGNALDVADNAKKFTDDPLGSIKNNLGFGAGSGNAGWMGRLK